jgi:hypothetical protein
MHGGVAGGRFRLRWLFCRTTCGYEQDAQKRGKRAHEVSREMGDGGKERRGNVVHLLAYMTYVTSF